MKDLKFLNAFNAIPGVGPATLRQLKNHFGSFEAGWHAAGSALAQSGIPQKMVELILWKRPSVNPDRELEKLIRAGIRIVPEDDQEYPALLKEIPHPPIALYCRGGRMEKIKEKNTFSLGIVGTRRPTSYGLEAAEKIARELAEAGVTIVSGLAMGIDGRSHEAAVDAGGSTIAVLGSGLNDVSIFPPEHRGLARRIIESDNTLISEYAPGTPAVKEHFPARNRIISGLSRGVIVVEARERSGALITARFALEQNREVFAVPGSIFSPTSAGPHSLIREGAKMIQNVQDILEEFGIAYTNKNTSDDAMLDENEHLILNLLEEPLGVDAIKEKTSMETPAIVATLSLLELKGRVKNLGSDRYQKV